MKDSSDYLHLLLERTSVEALIIWAFLALIVLYGLGKLLHVVTLTKVGTPMTLLMVGISLSIGYKAAVQHGKEIRTAPIFFGFIVMLILMYIAIYLMPEKFADMYSFMSMKATMMAMLR